MADDTCAELSTRIPDLPRVMRARGWTRGAALMEEWLNRGANSNPKNGLPNTTTIKMEWVLSYDRALAIYLGADAQEVWVNEAAQGTIVDKLIHKKGRLPKVVGGKMEFGNVGENISPGSMMQFHDAWQIQYRRVEQKPVRDDLDDLYAALGDFHFYYLVKGWVERLQDQKGKSRYRVTVNKVGVYVRDSYDFNDSDPEMGTPSEWAGWLLEKVNPVTSQPLGIWACATNYVGKFPWKNRYYVQNRDFREWRAKYGKGRGGDFMVFSDIKVIETNNSFEF